MNPIIIIPARMASTRLPGKPLIDICGEPMIIHVLRQAERADIGPVYVAAGDQEIVEVVGQAGGKALMTDPDLPSGSDRVFQALSIIDKANYHDVVINVQGDLPTIAPGIIRSVVTPLANKNVDIATLVAEIVDVRERNDPNAVKAVAAIPKDEKIGRALLFSRAAVPWGDGEFYHHIGLYAFRRAALESFVSLPQGILEKRENLEQLRALEAGMRIDVALVDTIPDGVDTPADLERARDRIAP
jgi:3-deoxy-manno-octulosonate cytidylyltransferase (CMP-KDO synthetase)